VALLSRFCALGLLNSNIESPARQRDLCVLNSHNTIRGITNSKVVIRAPADDIESLIIFAEYIYVLSYKIWTATKDSNLDQTPISFTIRAYSETNCA